MDIVLAHRDASEVPRVLLARGGCYRTLSDECSLPDDTPDLVACARNDLSIPDSLDDDLLNGCQNIELIHD
jgi:hypothetical protein